MRTGSYLPGQIGERLRPIAARGNRRTRPPHSLDAGRDRRRRIRMTPPAGAEPADWAAAVVAKNATPSRRGRRLGHVGRQDTRVEGTAYTNTPSQCASRAATAFQSSVSFTMRSRYDVLTVAGYPEIDIKLASVEEQVHAQVILQTGRVHETDDDCSLCRDPPYGRCIGQLAGPNGKDGYDTDECHRRALRQDRACARAARQRLRRRLLRPTRMEARRRCQQDAPRRDRRAGPGGARRPLEAAGGRRRAEPPAPSVPRPAAGLARRADAHAEG